MVCWGNNAAGQAAAPKQSFVALTAGVEHTCGLRVDGVAVCWGASNNGATAIPFGETFLSLIHI